MEIIIRNKNKIKGRSVTEFARNLESEGWPSEFANEGLRDKVAFIEKREGRVAQRSDLQNIKGE